MKGRRRDTPIPPAPDQGVGAIRRCGDLILPGRRDATVFHKFAWVNCEKSASREGIKKARDAITFQSEGIRKPENEMHRALASPVLSDGTKQGLATFTPVFEKFLIFLTWYKELLLFIMSVGYAEL